LRASANRVLRKIFGPKRDEVTVDWRKLHIAILPVLYSYTNIVRVIKLRRMRWSGRVARMRDRRGAHRVLVWKPDGRPRRRWEDFAKMDLKVPRWEGGCILVSPNRGGRCL